jgi:hypothetical protein
MREIRRMVPAARVPPHLPEVAAELAGKRASQDPVPELRQQSHQAAAF